MALTDRLDNLTEGLTRRFAALVDQNPASGERWGNLTGGGRQGNRWGDLIVPSGGGSRWGDIAQSDVTARYLGNSSGGFGLPNIAKAFDTFQGLQGQRLAKEAATQTTTTGQGVTQTGAPGAGWGQPSTAFLDAELVGSPLAGKGATIASIAAKYGVPVTVAMAILRQESSYGRNAANTFNYGGLTGGDPATGNRFRAFGSVEEGLDAVIGNMATPRYRDKSITDFMNIYAPSTDGNDTNAYINNVIALDHKWGGQSDRNTIVTGNRAPAPGTAGGGYSALWGGHGNPAITQDFGTTDFAEANSGIYTYATQFGLQPGQHTGLDIGLVNGTRLYAPRAGTVRIAGGSGYYKDESGRTDPATSGEVRILMDDGAEVILGHLSGVNVRVGQRVNPGDFVGSSGIANGDHLHLEVRIPDASTPSGWRIIDPRAYFK